MRAVKIVSFVLVLFAALYSVLWYFNGKANLRQVESWLATTAQSKSVNALTYESLTLKGYPFSIKVVLEKPKFSVNTGPLFSALAELNPGFSGPANMRGHMEIYNDESFIIQTNVIGSNYLFKPTGDTHVTHQANDLNLHIRTQGSQQIEMHLSPMKAISHYSNLEKLIAFEAEDADPTLKAFLQNFNLSAMSFLFTEVEMLEVQGTNISQYNGENDTLISTIDKINYGYEHKGDSNRLLLRAFADLKNMDLTDAYIELYKPMFEQMGFKMRDSAFDVYKKASGVFDIKYDGPTQKAYANYNGAMNIDLQIDLDNMIYNSTNKGLVKADFDQGKIIDIDIDVDSDALFNPESHAYLVDLYEQVLQEMRAQVPHAQGGDPSLDMMDYIEQRLDTFVPALHELGTIKSVVKLFGQEQDAQYQLDIKDISFVNQLYGVLLKGNLLMNKMVPIPEGEVNLTFQKLDTFLQRADRYVQILIKFYDDHQLEKPHYLNPELTAKANAFTRALANDTAHSDDVAIKTQFQTAPPFVKVGGRDENEFMQLFLEHFPPPPPPTHGIAPTDTFDE